MICDLTHIKDYGADESPGLDGFIFGFYRRSIDFLCKQEILDGSFILNELFNWCKKKKKQTMIFKVDFEKAYDLVRWDYLDDVFKKIGFGDRVVDAGMFRGTSMGPSLHLSHLFYADDDVFMDHWSDSSIDIIVQAAAKIGCATLEAPFILFKVKENGIYSLSFFNGVDHNEPFCSNGCDVFALKDHRYGRGLLKGFMVKMINLNVTATIKMSHENVGYSLRRIPKEGIEHVQFRELLASMEGVGLVDMRDRWVWSLEGSGEFLVALFEG
nr:RNA-directed DNA polymerase, eukaryota, reverse transcriptase zinc-binding domain protein [Tanacetum cinerariifolium]